MDAAEARPPGPAMPQTGMQNWRRHGAAVSGLLNLSAALAEAVAFRHSGPRKLFPKNPDRQAKTARSRCWTQRTEKPFARLFPFNGLTTVELKFRLPALRLPAA